MKEIGKTRQQRRDPGKPRGILRYPPGPGDFHHARIGPHPALVDLVQHFWIVRWDLCAATRRSSARPCPTPTSTWYYSPDNRA